jgi:hypothetical protein
MHSPRSLSTPSNASVVVFLERSNDSSRHAEIHHAELLQDWALLQSGKSPLKIEPLR